MHTRLAWMMLLSFLLVPSLVSSQNIRSMKLLNAGVGWAATDQRLFWTEDAGQDWKDITPKTSGGQIASVFFVDASTGWVALTEGDNASAPRFTVAETSNSGRSWSIVRVTVPNADPSRGLSKTAWISFADSSHGWLMVRMNGNTAFSVGVLMVTADAGKTWKEMHGPPTAGPLLFVSPTDGWLEGGSDYELYVTRNGGKRWHKVSLSTPAYVRAHLNVESASIFYDLPNFKDSKHGFLEVSYGDGTNGALVLFATTDGGRTWNSDRPLPLLVEAASSIVNSVWLGASISNQAVSLTKLALDRRDSLPEITKTVFSVPGFHGFGGYPDNELSFVDASHGWALAGELLSTSDGGTTWKDVTPSRSR